MSEVLKPNGGEGQQGEVIEKLTVQFEDGMTRANRDTLHPVIFEREEEYVRFTDHVLGHVDANGLEFTNVPIDLTLRVPRWILEETREDFSMRLVTEDDVRQVVEQLTEMRNQGRYPLDAENLKGFHIPGFPKKESET